MQHRIAFALVVILCAALAVLPATAADRNSSGYVYIMTNEPAGNRIVQYLRGTDGLLAVVGPPAGTPTGGLGGTGNGVGALDPLGSQDSLVLTSGGTRLVAVNAGSNTISSLSASGSGLTLINQLSSGGEFPNSVAVFGPLVYVLNAHTSAADPTVVPNVSGFLLGADGTLMPIPGSTHPLPGGSAAAPHDIRFSPDGKRLLVTEDMTNQIDVFEIGADGTIVAESTKPSSGPAPFGFGFHRGLYAVITEAGINAVSSYRLSGNDLNVVSASVPNGQMATCWISVTRNGHAFASNTASGTLSSYQIAADGTVNLAKAVAASIDPGKPIDSALSRDGSFLYVQDSALGRVFIFRVNGNSLAPIGLVNGLPQTQQGIAAQ